jgi:hypothetical protein
MFQAPASIAGVVDVDVVRGADAGAADVPAVVVEVAHGATKADHFNDLAAALRGPFPDDLIDFFFVNTDVGAPEGARAFAEALVAARPAITVLVLVCQIPRTFIDTNRIIESSTSTPHQPGQMTPGLAPYVTHPDDVALLRDRHRRYSAVVDAAVEAVVGGGGAAVFFHTYAPRSVDVAVDADIVKSLHAAYAPEKRDTWPLRPAVDLITTTPDGVVAADKGLVTAVVAALAAIDVDAKRGDTYPLHPSTSAAKHALRFPRRTLCLEVRRDLLVDAFTPFAEMTVNPTKAARIGGAIAAAVARWL